jgi:penicillin amidase
MKGETPVKKALCCAVAAIVLSLAAPQSAPAEEPIRTQKSLGGLKGSVEIVVDTYGVPHIYAESEDDAMFALGYLHARDRLWQMDFNRRAAQGRLSEIMGLDTLEHDTFVRTIGLNRLARKTAARVKEHAGLHSALTAYAWGINSYMAEHMPDGLPIEFQQIGYLPDPWTPTDSLAIGKAMAWELCGSMDDLYLGELAEKLGVEAINELFPIDRYNEVPIMPPGQPKRRADAATGGKASAGVEPLPPRAHNPPPAEAFTAAIEKASYRYRILGSDQLVGSNNWVIDGTKSVTGKPLLASDPHLGFTLPSVWYVAHYKARNLEVIGVTLPGLPFITIGHNRHIAWGVTNTQADVTDIFIENVNPIKNQYLHRGEWKPLEIISETIEVRGQEPKKLEIFKTVHGPVLPASGAYLSMQWAGAAPEDDARTFYLLNRAVDYDDFAAAMRTMGSPAQNFVYADTNGMIAMWVAGLFPMRKAGQGRIPQDGSSGDFDWKGFVPRIETPHSTNPAQHYLASANQRPASKEYGHYLGYEWDPGYRARRINQLLSSQEKFTARQMEEFQADTYDTLAASMLPHLTAACVHAFEEGKLYAQALDMLSRWDFFATADSVAPTIWWQWLERLRESVWQDEWRAAGIELRRESWGHAGINKWMPPLEVLERMVVEDPGSKWFDNVETENREMLVEIASTSLRTAVDELRGRLGDDISKWNWGVSNTLRIEHLSGDPTLARGGQPLSGSSLTLSSRGSGGDVTGGPSWRMVVDFSDLDALSAVYPGGQSGDSKSLHYDDLIDTWVRDEYISLPFHSSPKQFSPEQVELRMTLQAPLPHVESSLP